MIIIIYDDITLLLNEYIWKYTGRIITMENNIELPQITTHILITENNNN